MTFFVEMSDLSLVFGAAVFVGYMVAILFA